MTATLTPKQRARVAKARAAYRKAEGACDRATLAEARARKRLQKAALGLLAAETATTERPRGAR